MVRSAELYRPGVALASGITPRCEPPHQLHPLLPSVASASSVILRLGRYYPSSWNVMRDVWSGVIVTPMDLTVPSAGLHVTT